MFNIVQLLLVLNLCICEVVVGFLLDGRYIQNSHSITIQN
jgi:hypothetical protein